MKDYVSCVPCYFRQSMEAAKMAGADAFQLKRIEERIQAKLREIGTQIKAPEMVMQMFRVIKLEMDNPDPYQNLKQKANQWSMSLYPLMKRKIQGANDSLLSALKFAIVGNYLDSSPHVNPHFFEMVDKILLDRDEHAERMESGVFKYREFSEDLKQSRRVLYLGDNAGEVVFDKVLIETVLEADPSKSFIFATREKAVLNDCLVGDAEKCRMNECAEIISSGCEAPGIMLDYCSPEFLKAFREADLVISKGLGNYEALAGATDKRIYHLFVVNCPNVALELGALVGDMVLVGNPSP